MSSLKSLLGAGGGVQINQDIFLHSTAATVTVGDQVFLRSGYISDDLSTYPDATQYSGIDTASWDNKSFSVNSQDSDPVGLTFSSDGTKMYIVGNSNDTVYQYTLSTAWDVSTASYASKNFSVASQEPVPSGVTFSNDGTKMYIVGTQFDTVYQYTLSTAWDVSTASYASKSFSVNSQETSPFDITFSNDGTKMYILGSNTRKVSQYTLSTAWDVSTASYASKLFYVSQEPSAGGIVFSSDGTKMYMGGFNSNVTAQIHQYALSTAWDVSTASYTSKKLSVYSQNRYPFSLKFSSDGTKMYMLGAVNYGQEVSQYTLPAAVVGLLTEHTRGDATQYVRVK